MICENCSKCIIKNKKLEKIKLLNENKIKCTKCNEVKDLDCFTLQNRKKSLVKKRADCKECRKKRNREYYLRRKKDREEKTKKPKTKKPKHTFSEKVLSKTKIKVPSKTKKQKLKIKVSS